MYALNELEGVVVGIISRKQPCTAYSLRMELKSSPSSYWRASAGAIYPLLERLEREEVILTSEDTEDGRGRKLLSIAPNGKKALKNWIKAISDPDMIAEIYDPLRSRVFFLDALSHSEQLAFSKDTLAVLVEYQKVTQKHLKDRSKEKDPFEFFGALGGDLATRSRIKLVTKLLETLSEDRD